MNDILSSHKARQYLPQSMQRVGCVRVCLSKAVDIDIVGVGTHTGRLVLTA